ncbi:AraC family transcriptional regulator [Erythrobacter sp. THAF29]|uniref:helix-turn-helix domain-containing protein n=1 Tax=Erythrobacter sp. THAF29 TaxID=2587851 RepID=UPI0012682D99|nr:helix-turn-helix domain-containing protein [Erythrobacter sp. THAF29]QFT76174.1 Helix-turn-helix domain protein [Erythrobacter sp. THAF29]
MAKGHDIERSKGTGYSVRSDFYTPPAEFDGCFTTFYHLSLTVADGGTITDLILPEYSNIRFFSGARPDARIGEFHVAGSRFTATGPSARPCAFELGSSEMWGVGLLPLGWARLVNVDASQCANGLWDGATHPAFADFDAMTPILCDPEIPREEQLAAIAEHMRRHMRPSRDEPKILRVHKALVDGEFPTVGDLADACAMSVRTLERVCRRYFGFTPKTLMRRQRFIRSLATFMLHQGSRWTEAMDGDYHDQAQFTREFREFMTMNPSEYAALDHPIIASFLEARARVWGSAAQALDQPMRD